MTTTHLPAVEETLFASLLDERIGGLTSKFSALCFIYSASFSAACSFVGRPTLLAGIILASCCT